MLFGQMQIAMACPAIWRSFPRSIPRSVCSPARCSIIVESTRLKRPVLSFAHSPPRSERIYRIAAEIELWAFVFLWVLTSIRNSQKMKVLQRSKLERQTPSLYSSWSLLDPRIRAMEGHFKWAFCKYTIVGKLQKTLHGWTLIGRYNWTSQIRSSVDALGKKSQNAICEAVRLNKESQSLSNLSPKSSSVLD